MRKTKAIFSLVAIIAMSVNILPALAVDTSNIPACQFAGPPTQEQMAACQAAAGAAAGSGQPSGPNSNPGVNGPTGPTGIPEMPQMPTNIPTGPNGTAGGPPDMSKFLSTLPQPPQTPEGGMPPTFMGQQLSGGEGGGGAAAAGMAAASAQIGNALSQIKEGMLKAKEGMEDMRRGRIDVGDLEKTVNDSLDLYQKAQDAFAAGDMTKAGSYLQQFSGIDLRAKFAVAEDKMISGDLVSNVRKEMENALKDISKIKNADSEMDGMKAQLMASLEKVKQADEALKKGDKKTALGIMKTMRDSAPQDEAQGMMGKFKGMSKAMMGKILGQINEGLTRAGKGMNKSKASGIDVPADALALLEQAKAVYLEAQTAYDKGDYAAAADKLTELQKLNLEEKFTAFKKDMLPPDRMKTLSQMVADGIKALELTIQHTQEAGFDTTELQALLDKLKGIYANVQTAAADKDVETFLTYMDQVDALNISDKVSEIITKLANAQIKDLVAAGLEKLNNVVNALSEAITKLAAKKIDTSNANAVLASLKKNIADAQVKYDAGDYMAAGKQLDEAVSDMISLVNITRDSGVALAGERMKQINEIIALGNKGDSKQIVVSPDKIGQLDQIFATVGNDEAMDMKQAFMQFDPQLMDKVITQRQKDKKYMDAILKDVLPLIPAADREKVLEGKTGLLEEMASTDKTISNMKRIKGVTADTTKALGQIKDQIKAYNFDPGVADAVEKKMASFNDKIQSGEIKDPKEIANYIVILQQDTAQAIKDSVTKKFKEGLLPAKNIDDNNPLFGEVKKLVDDGAIKADGKGNIDLNKQLTGKQVADMINKTIDEKAVKTAPPSVMIISDVGNMVFNAYNVKPNIDPKNPGQMAKFFQSMGIDIKASEMKDKITMGDAADIIAAADQRWGRSGN